jgi:hypothetical protein
VGIAIQCREFQRASGTGDSGIGTTGRWNRDQIGAECAGAADTTGIRGSG